MSIQKINDFIIKHQKKSYTQVHNDVIRTLTFKRILYSRSLHLWTYLQGLPEDWDVRVEHLVKKFQTNERTIKNCFAFMHKNKLIYHERTRDKHGKFLKTVIHILNGDEFLNSFSPDSSCTEPDQNRIISTIPNHDTVDKVYCGLHYNITNKEKDFKDLVLFDKRTNSPTDLASPLLGQTQLPEIDYNPKPKKPKKPKKDYQEDIRFMLLYAIYLKKQKPRDAYKAFVALNPDDQLLETMVNDIKLRNAKETQWQDVQFVPLLASYIRGYRWEDAIINAEEEAKKKKDALSLLAKDRQSHIERLSDERYAADRLAKYAEEQGTFNRLVAKAQERTRSVPVIPAGLINLKASIGLK